MTWLDEAIQQAWLVADLDDRDYNLPEAIPVRKLLREHGWAAPFTGWANVAHQLEALAYGEYSRFLHPPGPAPAPPPVS